MRIWPSTMPHAHSFFELGCVFDGHAEWLFPELEEKVKVQKGEWILVPPYYHHHEAFEKSTPATIGWIGFKMDLKHPIANELQERSLIAFKAPREPDNPEHYFEELKTEQESAKAHWKTKLQLSLLSLIVCLLRESPESSGRKPVHQKPSSAPSDTTFTDLLELSSIFIQKYCGSPLTVEDVAKRYGMAPSTFGRLFKKRYGLTPKAYQMRARVELTKKHLVETSDTLYNIAYAYGFHDESHFSRIFKQHTRMTPGQWRLRHKKISTHNTENALIE